MKLWPSQRAALDAARDKDMLALWAQPRSGKTATALLWALSKHPSWVFVVGPKIAAGVWEKAAVDWGNGKVASFFLEAGKPDPAPEALLAAAQRDVTPLVFVNYELCYNRSWTRVKKFLDSMQRVYPANKAAALLDESHLIKSPRAQSGRNLRRVAPMFAYRAILTGTPVSNVNAVTETYGQWTFLDPSIRERFPSALAFREHFGEWTSYKGFPELVRARNVPELHTLLSEHVVTLTDRAESPRTRVVRFSADAATRRVLEDLRRTNVAVLPDGQTVYAELPITRLLEERKVVGGTAWAGAHTRRTKALLHSLGSHPGKAVVACAFLDEVDVVERALREAGRPVWRVTGSTKDKHRVLEEFAEHQSHEATLVVQPATVSVAVDMRAAQQVVWYTLGTKYSEYKQMSDRVKLANNPLITILQAEGTVDEELYLSTVRNKKHLTKTMTGVTKHGR